MQLTSQVKEKLLTELIYSSSRSSGPGGQNVNKLSSKVELRFEVTTSESLNDLQKQIIIRKLKNRITKSGELVLTSQKERTQRQNKQIVTSKFFELIEEALMPVKKRIRTKPGRAVVLKRLEWKKKHSQKKLLRKDPEQY
jgi:ribosome-associated protein